MKNNTVEVDKKPDCDFCGDEAEYDGKTKLGSWAYMCESCFNSQGIGLGIGRGQKLVVRRGEV